VHMKEKLSLIQVSILIYMIQSGVTLFSLPRLTAEAFGTNGWISIIIFYMIVNINLVLIWLVFKMGNGRSMVEIISFLPKWITLPLVMILASVWLGLGTMVMVKFIFLLKMLFYPNVSTLLLMFMALGLVFILLANGIYHIAKATLVLFYFTIWTVFLLSFHLQDFSFTRLTPFLFQGEKDLLKGGFRVFTAFLGYELSIVFFHFVEKKKLTTLIWGNTITSLIYLGVCFLCYGFFSFEMLVHEMFPVVTIMEYISLPVLERVENLIFSLFGLKVLITTVMYLWSAKEVLENQFKHIKSKYMLGLVLTVSFLVSMIPNIMRELDRWLEYLAFGAAGIAVFLPIFLLMSILFIKAKKENSL
jgi:spore germination protein (amino acid permease)